MLTIQARAGAQARAKRPMGALGLTVLLVCGSVLITNPQTAHGQNLDRRVDRLEDRLSGPAMMRMMNQNQTLQREITSLRGEIERLQRQMDDIRDQQRQLYLDLDGRIQALESAQPAGDPPTDEGRETGEPESSMPDGGAENEQTGSTTDQDESAARAAYDEAFGALQAGRYDAAAEAFDTFIDTYPDVDLTANARYWLGESYYVVRDFDRALEAFQSVIDNHPGSRKHPDALLKMGYVHLEQDRTEEGQEALQTVVDDFPDSTAASLASTRLDEL
jgi:tol-pal system protein YbgF